VVHLDTLRTIVCDTQRVIVHQTIRRVVGDTLRTVVRDTIRSVLVEFPRSASSESAAAAEPPTVTAEALKAMRTAIGAGRMPADALARLTHGVPELTKTPVLELTGLQTALLSQATGIAESSVGFFRWGRYAAAARDSLAGATFLTVWPGTPDTADAVVLVVDAAERFTRK
jgi:hypothetical protein